MVGIIQKRIAVVRHVQTVAKIAYGTRTRIPG